MAGLTVLSIQPESEIYGALRALLRAYRAMPAGACRLIAVFPGPGPAVEAFRRAGAEVAIEPRIAVLRRQHMHPVGMLRLTFNLVVSAWRISRVARRERVDVLHSNSAFVLTGGLLGLVGRRPHVWHVRECPTDSPRLRRLLSRAVRRGAGLAAVVSSASGSMLDARTQQHRTPDGYDPAEMTGAERQGDLVACVGRISRTKGQVALIQALARAREEHHLPDGWRLWIVGTAYPGNEADAERLVEEVLRAGLEERVDVLGHVEPAAEVFERASVVVVPTLTGEGFGNVALEAMAHGALVVASAQGGIDDLVEDGVTGLRAPAGARGAPASAVARALDPANADEMNAIREKARAHAATFSTQASAERLLEAFDRARGRGA